ncbi:MAG TPA: PEPxxWA-CTERM sorting domain-containing protein [Phenylobacterium sp.]
MRTRLLSSVALAGAIALAVGTTAHAQLVTNGDFTSGPAVNTQFGGPVAPFTGQPVTGWTGVGLQFYYQNATAATVSALNQYGDPFARFNPGTFVASPTGGGFVALDGDPLAQGSIHQTISGLTVGAAYTLTFDWAASQLVTAHGATTDFLAVSFGADSFNTATDNVASQGFVGWNSVSHTFIASSTSEVLNFLSVGSPAGLPPIALLDNVVLAPPVTTRGGGVPEPATWAMMLIGFGGIGALIRRRRHTLQTA